MPRSMTLNVRLTGALGDHVADAVGEYGLYENVSEYVRDLIRRDHARVEQERFETLRRGHRERQTSNGMSDYRIEAAAVEQIEDIYIYSVDVWGEGKAREYLTGLYAFFGSIVDQTVVWRPLPAGFGINGFVGRYRSHYIYWRMLPDGDIGIAAILHERMHQRDRFRDALNVEP